jgi:hypothetical protein
MMMAVITMAMGMMVTYQASPAYVNGILDDLIILAARV